ncbi:hypothetical protein EU803_15665 [Loktanella sp. IMCC34160]|uniref:glycosyltransferase family 29 protein n=1 Tax=Loktanella sp. IMCC34160 TaxID=2510646 RepID=UPI00101CBB5A|nr:glycosyltransferase family 29 protein [Loktanella sp. IMCC34160]RYG90051.1 hypothetical protein EU803_15665 [Loktanella sp. IMCC34160]
MNKIDFYWARLRRQESTLAELSVGIEDLADELRGKSVALVGNARSLSQSDKGTHIDCADVVIRINSAPIPSARSHGTHTDWHALAVRNSRSMRDRVGAQRYLWMSHKRKRLDWATASSPGFYLSPMEHFQKLMSQLGARPTTGLMLIDLLERLPAESVDLFGFDFFDSLSLTGNRTAEQVPHDFEAERKWVHDLLDRDGRFVLHQAVN